MECVDTMYHVPGTAVMEERIHGNKCKHIEPDCWSCGRLVASAWLRGYDSRPIVSTNYRYVTVIGHHTPMLQRAQWLASGGPPLDNSLERDHPKLLAIKRQNPYIFWHLKYLNNFQLSNATTNHPWKYMRRWKGRNFLFLINFYIYILGPNEEPKLLHFN